MLRAAAVAGALLAMRCSLALDTSAQQCSRDSDCMNRGGAFASAVCANHVCLPPAPGGDDGGGVQDDASSDPVWGCLGHVTMDTPQAPTAKVAIPFWDLIRMAPVTDIAMQTCAKLDVSCSKPLGPFIRVGQDGILRTEVPTSTPFDGYGQIITVGDDEAGTAAVDDGGTATDAGAPPSTHWMPSLVFFNPPLVRDTTYGQVPLFHPDDVQLIAQSQGNTVDPALGIAFVGVLDCSGNPAAGATWEPSVVDMKSRRFFYINSFPDEAATATDKSGRGGLVNAPVGTLTVTATVAATGKRIGSATVLVRPGVASYTFLAPTP